MLAVAGEAAVCAGEWAYRGVRVGAGTVFDAVAGVEGTEVSSGVVVAGVRTRVCGAGHGPGADGHWRMQTGLPLARQQPPLSRSGRGAGWWIHPRRRGSKERGGWKGLGSAGVVGAEKGGSGPWEKGGKRGQRKRNKKVKTAQKGGKNGQIKQHKKVKTAHKDENSTKRKEGRRKNGTER